jgi:hypothetical protein
LKSEERGATARRRRKGGAREEGAAVVPPAACRLAWVGFRDRKREGMGAGGRGVVGKKERGRV